MQSRHSWKSFFFTIWGISRNVIGRCSYSKKIYGSGLPLNFVLRTAALKFSNEEVEDITKIDKSLEESGLLVKGISETNKNENKEEKGGFLLMLLGILATSILGSALTGKGVIKTGEGTTRAGENFWCPPSFDVAPSYKNVIKMNLNLIAFIQEIIYLKQKIGHI